MKSPLLLGIDIGGTKCAVVSATPDGTLLHRRSLLTRSGQRGPESVLEELTTLAHEVIVDSRTMFGSDIELLGIGVSCGGPLDTRTGVIHAPPNLPDWIDVPVKSYFETRFGIRTVVENDANADSGDPGGDAPNDPPNEDPDIDAKAPDGDPA